MDEWKLFVECVKTVKFQPPVLQTSEPCTSDVKEIIKNKFLSLKLISKSLSRCLITSTPILKNLNHVNQTTANSFQADITKKNKPFM